MVLRLVWELKHPMESPIHPLRLETPLTLLRLFCTTKATAANPYEALDYEDYLYCLSCSFMASY
jgi:hypothetical protein